MPVIVRGMAISHNCTHLALLAKDTGAGDFEEMSLMDGSHMTPEMLKVNPWHQIPNMSDGDLNLGESGAILRYIANKYAPDKYGGSDSAKKATIDWALEWMSANFGKVRSRAPLARDSFLSDRTSCADRIPAPHCPQKDFQNLWYPVAGFGPAPADQAAANKQALENLETFASVFLLGPGKFVGGFAEPSIADYLIAVKMHCIGVPAIKAKVGVLASYVTPSLALQPP